MSGINWNSDTGISLSLKWGEQAQKTLDRQKGGAESDKEKTKNECMSILGKCIDAFKKGLQSYTLLVVGNVQSGKTRSFNTSIGLSYDCGFPMVILMTGKTTKLYEQSVKRLKRDLNYDDVTSPFSIYEKPKENDWLKMKGLIDNWRESNSNKNIRRKTIVITVMKNTDLSNLLKCLNKFESLIDLPAMIIDDEADQASLDVGRKNMTPTFRNIIKIREQIPYNSYLQYTGTPGVITALRDENHLAPDSSEVIESGEDYVGLEDFFINTDGLVKIVPESDVISKNNQFKHMKESLRDALLFFIVGVTIRLELGCHEIHSMNVHPDSKVPVHDKYYNWIEKKMEYWRKLFKNQNDTKRDIFIQQLRDVYDDLKNTIEEKVPSFDKIIKRVLEVLNEVETVKVNQENKEKIDWNQKIAWILVGGNILGRGFTLEGLTVTYMTRSTGKQNADTIYQFARFLGYKKEYLGYCRVFITEKMCNAFEGIIDFKNSLAKYLIINGEKLKGKRRIYHISPELNIGRITRGVRDLQRDSVAGKWIHPNYPIEKKSILEKNRENMEFFIEEIKNEVGFDVFEGNSDYTTHDVCEIPVNKIISMLENQKWTDKEDITKKYSIIEILNNNKSKKGLLYIMGQGISYYRSIDKNKKQLSTASFFQGQSYERQRSENYIGQRNLFDPDIITIQVYFFDIGFEKHAKGKFVAENIPLVAVRVPVEMELPIIREKVKFVD